jgi:hypothetical protein
MEIINDHEHAIVIHLLDVTRETFDSIALMRELEKYVSRISIWSVTVVLHPDVADANADFFRDLGFNISGNLTKGTGVTFVKMTKQLRTSGEAGSSLAMAEPILGRFADEERAIALMLERYGQIG